MQYYGTTLYEPNWWAKLTGMDWGTERCLRNSMEAYVCFSEMMFKAESQFGWNTQVVNYLVKKAFDYRGNANLQDSAYQFWEAVQNNFMSWVKDTGWNVVDLPRWEGVLRQMDSSTEGAFEYAKAKKEADRIFLNTAISTSSDLWYLWMENVPKSVRIATYVVVGGAVLSYTYPIFNVLGKLIFIGKKKR